MSDCTIFTQDGIVYCALSHLMPARDLARETAREIRYMSKIPRARMMVCPVEEVREMKFDSPKKEGETLTLHKRQEMPKQ